MTGLYGLCQAINMKKTYDYVMYVPVIESLDDAVDRFFQSRLDCIDYLCDGLPVSYFGNEPPAGCLPYDGSAGCLPYDGSAGCLPYDGSVGVDSCDDDADDDVGSESGAGFNCTCRGISNTGNDVVLLDE